ncbi:MAG: multifunctional CCA addition/repair protein, partial [Gammaproteobacteria bacterium]|nr:multifunctional CCA addition/repair protein [Gammaproteobacteria bacterium]
MEIYEVGGAVRDSLLGLPVADRDWVVVGATDDDMLRLGYEQVGRDFPVFLHPETNEQYALARRERKSGRGHTGFAVDASADVSLEDDLLRRDLTINAIARDAEGRIIDPHGGQHDLERRRLRHVSDAFAEDPLRVLRTARFAARFDGLGFIVDPATLALMTEIAASGELETLSPERVWQETEKALTTAHPATYFRVLRECGALAVVFPEIDRLFGVPQPARWHPEIDTGVHTLLALTMAAELSNDPVVRFAVLVHDLGKGTTPKAMLPRHHGHEQRSIELLAEFGERLRVPNRYLSLAYSVAKFHGHAHRVDELKPKKLLQVLTEIGALRNPAVLEDFIAACEADARGRDGSGNAVDPTSRGPVRRRRRGRHPRDSLGQWIGSGWQESVMNQSLTDVAAASTDAPPLRDSRPVTAAVKSVRSAPRCASRDPRSGHPVRPVRRARLRSRVEA